MTQTRTRPAIERGGTASAAQVVPPAPVKAGSMGILGGTFDPIHHGHLAIAEEVRERLGLERVVFIPASIPPHRPDVPRASALDRLAMVRLAIASNPAFEASAIEIERTGRSYTVDTLAALAALGPSAASTDRSYPAFIVSSEAFEGFESWREPGRILELATLVVVPRDGHAMPGRPSLRARFGSLADRIVLIDGPLLAVSGSAIRARAAAGRSLRYLVPDAVAAYIEDHRLYRSERRTPSP